MTPTTDYPLTVLAPDVLGVDSVAICEGEVFGLVCGRPCPLEAAR